MIAHYEPHIVEDRAREVLRDVAKHNEDTTQKIALSFLFYFVAVILVCYTICVNGSVFIGVATCFIFSVFHIHSLLKSFRKICSKSFVKGLEYIVILTTLAGLTGAVDVEKRFFALRLELIERNIADVAQSIENTKVIISEYCDRPVSSIDQAPLKKLQELVHVRRFLQIDPLGPVRQKEAFCSSMRRAIPQYSIIEREYRQELSELRAIKTGISINIEIIAYLLLAYGIGLQAAIISAEIFCWHLAERARDQDRRS